MLWILVFSMLLMAMDVESDDAFTKIAEGQVRGTSMVSFQGREFHAYRGIPYAEPPTGTRRFKPPQRKSPWSGVLNATVEGSVCPQMLLSTEEYTGNENCLFLNVYTHKDARQNPVIVWIHGGAFIEGHGGVSLAGPKYLMDHDIVLMTFNYRLGPLGFLSTGDSALPGNYGLKDAVEVLRWIQRNIESFGGSRNLVTVFGYSSGAACAHSLTMSSLTKGLIHRVIFESGSALHYWAFRSSPAVQAHKVAEEIGCPSRETSSDIANCLAEVPAEKLIRTLYIFPRWAVNYPVPYGIVKEVQEDGSDPPFLTETPMELVRKGQVLKIPSITGITSSEYIIVPYLITHNDKLAMELDDHFETILLKNFFTGNISMDIVNKVKAFYFKGKSAKNATFQELVDLFSDVRYNYNTYQTAKAYGKATRTPVYVYMFAFEGRLSVIVKDKIHPTPLGVNHADDLFFIFERGVEFPGNGPNPDETKTIMRVTKMLSDFALTGDPTPNTSDLITQKWMPLNGEKETFQYFEINSELKMHSGPIFEERMAFWDSLFAHKLHDEL